MEVLSFKNKFGSILGSKSAPCEAGPAGESNIELSEDSLKVPLMTEEDEGDCSNAFKENYADTVKQKVSMVVGAMKAKASSRPDVAKVKNQLLKLGAVTISEARSAAKLGAGTMTKMQDHLEVAFFGKAAESDCMQTLSAQGFSEKDIEHAIEKLGTVDVAEVEAYLRFTQANDDIAAEKLLAMGFAHDDVVKVVHKLGSQNQELKVIPLEMIVASLCKLQDKRLLREQRKDNAHRLAKRLQLGESPVAAEADMQLEANLSKSFSYCNSNLATCLRLAESQSEKPARHSDVGNKVSTAPMPSVDALGLE